MDALRMLLHLQANLPGATLEFKMLEMDLVSIAVRCYKVETGNVYYLEKVLPLDTVKYTDIVMTELDRIIDRICYLFDRELRYGYGRGQVH